MGDLTSNASPARRESFLTALLSTLSVSLSEAVNWTQEAASAYARRVVQVSVGLLLVMVVAGAVYVGGVYFRQPWMLVLSVLVSGIAVSLFILITLPVWALAAKFAEIRAVRVVVRAIGFVLLLSFLLALAFMVIPITEGTAVVVPVGAAAIALLGAVYGVGPNPSSVYAKVVSVMITAVGISIFSTHMPQTFQQVRDLATPLDQIISRKVTETVYKPNKLSLDSVERLRAHDFFDPKDGNPLVWYNLSGDASIELFDRHGVHPTTGERLVPIDPVVVKRLIRDAEKREADSRRRPSGSIPPPLSQQTAAAALPNAVPMPPQPHAQVPPASRPEVSEPSQPQSASANIATQPQARPAPQVAAAPFELTLDPSKLEGDLNRALRGHDVRGVTAQVGDDGVVTLKGSANSANKDRALQISRTFRGVKSVKDQVFVVE